MRIPAGLWTIGKEVLRHLLRRPVVGVCVLARTKDGRILLIRRGDTGQWALPGGTVEWGETLRSTVPRELWEEAGVEQVEAGELLGVYSSPDRDPRFHAVTVLVSATVEPPTRPPMNALEVREVALFEPEQVPPTLSHGNLDMLRQGLKRELSWE